MKENTKKELAKIDKTLAKLKLESFFMVANTKHNSFLLTRGQGEEVAKRMAVLCVENPELLQFLMLVTRLSVAAKGTIKTIQDGKLPGFLVKSNEGIPEA